MKNINLGFMYTKAEDRRILSRRTSDGRKNVSDRALASDLGRTPGAVRQRRYILTSA